MAGPLIVTALLGSADQAVFDRLRSAHFPPERNQLQAHLTMFHAIPLMLEAELRHRLAALSGEISPPPAVVSGPRPLDVTGLAYHHYEDGPWRLGRRYPFRAKR